MLKVNYILNKEQRIYEWLIKKNSYFRVKKLWKQLNHYNIMGIHNLIDNLNTIVIANSDKIEVLFFFEDVFIRKIGTTFHIKKDKNMLIHNELLKSVHVSQRLAIIEIISNFNMPKIKSDFEGKERRHNSKKEGSKANKRAYED